MLLQSFVVLQHHRSALLSLRAKNIRCKGQDERYQPQPQTRPIVRFHPFIPESLSGLDKVDQGKEGRQAAVEGSEEL